MIRTILKGAVLLLLQLVFLTTMLAQEAPATYTDVVYLKNSRCSGWSSRCGRRKEF